MHRSIMYSMHMHSRVIQACLHSLEHKRNSSLPILPVVSLSSAPKIQRFRGHSCIRLQRHKVSWKNPWAHSPEGRLSRGGPPGKSLGCCQPLMAAPWLASPEMCTCLHSQPQPELFTVRATVCMAIQVLKLSLLSREFSGRECVRTFACLANCTNELPLASPWCARAPRRKLSRPGA